jgi:hypothetical protein
MATEKTAICGSCRTIVILGNAAALAGSKCKKCGQPFTGNEAGIPKPKQLRLEGRIPAPSEIGQLRRVPFAKKPLSSGELKEAVFTILAGVIGGPLLVLFGRWVIGKFTGPGVLFFGYGGVLAGAIILPLMLIMGIYKILRNPRKKSIKDVFDWIWKESYFNNTNFTAERYISVDDAYSSAVRAVPSEISDAADMETLKAYITRIRERVDQALDKEEAKVDVTGKFTNGASVNWTAGNIPDVGYPEIGAETEKEEGIKEASGTLKIVKRLTVPKNNKGDTYTLDVSAVELSIHGLYVNNGKYWFPLDLMPEIAEEQEEQLED